MLSTKRRAECACRGRTREPLVGAAVKAYFVDPSWLARVPLPAPLGLAPHGAAGLSSS
ncbi:hypothetical protein SPHINGOT1_140071 [Sphingomonas sp. T1]|nr:hypothetical protein SPHINGOT1_140071 [Sphingomonas sp. T1]